MIGKKEKYTYSDEAFRRIKQLILNQEVIPGQKLVYDDLAKRLKMSRTPIINALNRLEQLGLVVSESNRGDTVTNVLPLALCLTMSYVVDRVRFR